MIRRRAWWGLGSVIGLGLLLSAVASRSDPPTLDAALMAWLRDVAGDRASGRGLVSDGHHFAVQRLEAAAMSLGLRPVEGRSARATLPLVRLGVGDGTALQPAAASGPGASRRIQRAGIDIIPLYPAAWGYPATLDVRAGSTPVVFAGRLGDSAAVQPLPGPRRIVLVEPPLRPDGLTEYDIHAYAHLLEPLTWAFAIGIVAADLMPAAAIARAIAPRYELTGATSVTGLPPVFLITDKGAKVALSGMGARADVRVHIREDRVSRPPRNLMFLLEGHDPRRKDEVVILSAPSDHIGTRAVPGGETAVYPGADDGGSGAVALLGVARLLSDPASRPARSVLFVWHAGTEHALLGSEWFLRHPAVPRDRIVAALNVERLARGGDTLFAVGARRLVSPLGNWVRSYAESTQQIVDWSWDAPRHIAQRDCRSDHVNYARAGIPALTINSGVHEDWRQPTDVVERIDAARYAARVRWMAGLVRAVADQPTRPQPAERVTPSVDRRCEQ